MEMQRNVFLGLLIKREWGLSALLWTEWDRRSCHQIQTEFMSTEMLGSNGMSYLHV